MSYSTCGPEQRYPYKKKNGINGGHFGASMAMTSTPTATIGGLCTPCHDPHGVSPTLGANQQYAVPLLKGTWLTSPYKEDVAPRNDVSGTIRTDYGFEGVPYHIDQNTFSLGRRNPDGHPVGRVVPRLSPAKQPDKRHDPYLEEQGQSARSGKGVEDRRRDEAAQLHLLQMPFGPYQFGPAPPDGDQLPGRPA